MIVSGGYVRGENQTESSADRKIRGIPKKKKRDALGAADGRYLVCQRLTPFAGCWLEAA